MKYQSRLKEIQQEKDEIDQLKKKSRKESSKKPQQFVNQNGRQIPLVPTDGFSKPNGGGQAILNEGSEFDLEESEFNNIDKDEQKEIYQFKIKLLENEERRIKE